MSGQQPGGAARPLLLAPLACYPLMAEIWLDPSTAPQTVLVYEELPAPPAPPAPPGAPARPGAKGGGTGGGTGGGALRRTPLQRLSIDAVPRRVIDQLTREGKPVQRRLRVGVDASGLLEVEIDDLDEPEARWGGGRCGQLLLLLLLLSGLVGFATSVLGLKPA